MRPSLNMLSDKLTGEILDEAKRIMAETGMEIRGANLKQRLLAALAGVNSVSGPGMLDFVLTFSLPKLVFYNEVCGQALRFVREVEPMDDLPSGALVSQLLQDDHLITSPHTLEYWRKELYLTNPVLDRNNRETWEEAGGMKLDDRSCMEFETRLANYQPFDTDPETDVELRRIVIDGLDRQTDLPELSPQPEPPKLKGIAGRRGRAGRRRWVS